MSASSNTCSFFHGRRQLQIMALILATLLLEPPGIGVYEDFLHTISSGRNGVSARSLPGHSPRQQARVEALLRAPRRDFSSLQCTAGSQLFDDQLHAPHAALHPVSTDDPSLRLCLLRNVCLINNKLTIYIDPHDQASLPPDLLPTAFLPSGLFFCQLHRRNLPPGPRLRR